MVSTSGSSGIRAMLARLSSPGPGLTMPAMSTPLRTNKNRLVMQSVIGEIASPLTTMAAYRVGADGTPRVYPATGGIVYNYRIGGTLLGLVFGKDLLGIAEHERAIAEGHTFNARLAEALNPIVPANKRVKDAVAEKRLQMIFRQIRETHTPAA